MRSGLAVGAVVLISIALLAPVAGRAQTAAAGQTSGSSGLVGRWQSADSVVQINADGTLSVDGTQYRYTVQGTTLTLIGYDGSIPVPFKLTGDTLLVSLNGQLITMQRIRPGQSESAGGLGGTGTGSSGAELVGKWCYIANFTANNGGRISDECITIGQDGSYRYHRETSSSGQYGSAASTQDDYGTWRLNGSTLMVNSRSQGAASYQLTKRNHPKNTSDPMICLDGRCFVTFGPKPPWR